MSSPTVLVEIAFNAGYSTPAASRTWTDVTAYVLEGSKINITYGRQDELGVCDANQLSLTLNNSDGRFTWGNASSPYYPNVLIGRPIRVTVGGSVRFTGYVNEWPVEWPGVVSSFATASITASSRLSRLGLNSPLKSVVEEEILRDSPIAYYTLGEPEGATQASDSSGAAADALIPVGDGEAVTFGTATGPGTDGLTAATFAGSGARSGKRLAAELSSDIAAIECFFSTASAPASDMAILAVANGGSVTAITMFSAGDIGLIRETGSGADPGTPNLADGSVHHVAWNLSTGALYVDGVTYATAVTETSHRTLNAGGTPYDHTAAWLQLNGSLAHVAAYSSAPSAARFADHAEAGSTGFAGETTDDRLDNYAAWAGIPAAEVVSSTSAVTLNHIDPTGTQVVEMMRKVETAEAGVLHDNRDGNLELEPRSARYGTTVAVTLDASSGQVGMDYRPNVDRSNLYTIGQGSNLDGTVTARYTNEARRSEYGDTTYTVETAAQDDSEPLQRVAWVVNANSTPRPRAPQVTVNLMPYGVDVIDGGTPPAPLDELDGGSASGGGAVVDGGSPTGPSLVPQLIDIGSKIRITNAPTQAPAATADYFVEGYSETIGASVWSLTLNLSPVDPYDDVLILDSATDGLLDTNILAL